MSLKENLKAKMKIDKLVKKLISTMKEPPGKWWLDKGPALRSFSHMTDFEHEKVRDLQLYVRPFDGKIMEVLVLDNALPIYRTTVNDVVLRKSPCWHEMVNIRNIRKIMNDKDVLISKGKASLEKLHADAHGTAGSHFYGETTWRRSSRMRVGVWPGNPFSGYRNACIFFLNCWIFNACFLGRRALI
jgi:hypothetical protein